MLPLISVIHVVAQHTGHVYLSGWRSAHVCLFLFDLEVSRLVRTSVLSVLCLSTLVRNVVATWLSQSD